MPEFWGSAELTPEGVLEQGEHYCRQGDVLVGQGEHVVFTTLLGSCVSVCMFDTVAGVGGLNHILLPLSVQARADQARGAAVHAMELLVNPLLRAGASRRRLNAKIFGGASFGNNLGTIGADNVDFARSFLTNEGISVVAESVGGNSARQLRFFPSTGRVRQRIVGNVPSEPMQVIGSTGGDLELF